MMCNVGNVDRVVRLLAGIVLISLALLFIPTLLPKIIVLAIAVLLWLSAWFGVCFLYKLVGMATTKQKESIEHTA